MNQKLVTNIMSTTARRTPYIHALIHVGMIWHRLPCPVARIQYTIRPANGTRHAVYPLPPFSAHNRTDCIGVRPPEEEREIRLCYPWEIQYNRTAGEAAVAARLFVIAIVSFSHTGATRNSPYDRMTHHVRVCGRARALGPF